MFVGGQMATGNSVGLSRGDRAERRIVGVILAGGTGQRVGLNIPKQLVKIAGKAILQHTLETFDKAASLSEIIVMMAPGFEAEAEKVVAAAQPAKPVRVLSGGASRPETTCLALAAIDDDDAEILLHDAVRPLVNVRIIEECCRTLVDHRAVDVAIPSSDTIIVVDERDGEEFIDTIPPRASLRRGQTPQAFRVGVLRQAYALAAQDPDFAATDDCGVVRRYLPEIPIRVVPGSEENLKVTQPIDIHLADKLFQLASQEAPSHRSPEEFRAHMAGRAAVVFGASYGIGEEIAMLLRAYGVEVHGYSRTATGTHVENEEHVAAALQEAYAISGRVDFVVNTAAVLEIGRITDVAADAVRRALDVNLLGPVNIARAAQPYLRETGGSMLLFTSSSYTRGRSSYSLYSATKAAVVNLTQALAEEWAEEGVRVNCINPERTRTPMRIRAFGAEPENMLLTANEVARTSVDVLVSDVTGHIFDVRRDQSAAAPVPAVVSDVSPAEGDVSAALPLPAVG
jgi:2-C-methyl-D-erythritol 4-phosphate cytidylyltransferase